jgi:hypothetical protein
MNAMIKTLFSSPAPKLGLLALLGCVLAAPACSATDTPASDGGGDSSAVPMDAVPMDAVPMDAGSPSKLDASTADAQPLTDAGPNVDAAVDSAMGSDATADTCSVAREQGLMPINKVSTGEVVFLRDEEGGKVIYVDASAGGRAAAPGNPRLYLNLGTRTRVDVTDTAARTSTAWDLALKLEVLFSNSGDGGIGQGGATLVSKDFAMVTASDAPANPLFKEFFFDADCNIKRDRIGNVLTSLEGWYQYDQATMRLSPGLDTLLVRGATGSLYKVRVLKYRAKPDGTDGTVGGRYLLNIAPLL